MPRPKLQETHLVCLRDGTAAGSRLLTIRGQDGGRFSEGGFTYYCRQSHAHDGKYVIYKETAIPGNRLINP